MSTKKIRRGELASLGMTFGLGDVVENALHFQMTPPGKSHSRTW
jgi:hypothetical protein